MGTMAMGFPIPVRTTIISHALAVLGHVRAIVGTPLLGPGAFGSFWVGRVVVKVAGCGSLGPPCGDGT